MISEVLLCPSCKNPLKFRNASGFSCCEGAPTLHPESGIVKYHRELDETPPQEMVVRDSHASGYMKHRKFPTQVDRISRFIRSVKSSRAGNRTLDLGCGPGPTTALLLDAGFEVCAVDFSWKSLELNSADCRHFTPDHIFVQANLNEVAFSPLSVDGLMMADFLQHLGSYETQRAFLHKAFAALKPGGWFYLSFFNTNIVNRMKRDIEGSFAEGRTPYRRMSAKEVRGMFPDNVVIKKIEPMNIFHEILPDRILTSLPLSSLLARMVAFSGRKKP